jgi:hypothetical protein
MRNFFQIIIIKTSFPPLTFLYKLLYVLSIKFAVFVFKKVKGVDTIYLRRGIAKNEIVYGLSDIDLSIIINDKENIESAKEKIVSIYARFSHCIPLFADVNRELGIYSASEFLKLHGDNPFSKYRFNEGKYSWKLLFGKDIVKDLPELPDEALYLPATEELKTWWHLLNFEFSSYISIPQFQRKYIWYKAIADMSKVYLFVCHGEKVHDREGALHRVKRYLTKEQKPCIDKIERYLKNLASRENLIVDDLMRLFIDLTHHTFGVAERKAYPHEFRKKAVLSSPNYNDLLIDKRLSNTVEEVEKYIKSELQFHLKQTALIPQVYFGLDVLHNSDIDSMYMVLVVKEYIPVKKLEYLVSLFDNNCSSQKIEPFIKAGDLALSLWAKVEHLSIQTPRQCPLFYSLITHLSSGMVKNHERKTVQSDLSPDFDEYIRKRAEKIDKVISDPGAYKLKPLSFLRFFWSSLRTKLLDFSLQNEYIKIPLTSRQICEMANQFSPEDAEWLNDLYKGYTKELQGEESQSYRFFAKSVDFLTRI